jgi:hypothetical protein
MQHQVAGQFLHAKSLAFVHPNGKVMKFEAPLPQFWTEALEEIEKKT